MNDKKIKILSISVIALILINVTMIVLIVLPHRSHVNRVKHDSLPTKHRGVGFLIKQLDLDKNQKLEFRELAKNHREEKDQLDQELHRNKAMLVAAVMENNEVAKDSLLTIISELNNQNEYLMVDHFSSLKAICTEAQALKLAHILAKNDHRKKP